MIHEGIVKATYLPDFWAIVVLGYSGPEPYCIALADI